MAQHPETQRVETAEGPDSPLPAQLRMIKSEQCRKATSPLPFLVDGADINLAPGRWFGLFFLFFFHVVTSGVFKPLLKHS